MRTLNLVAVGLCTVHVLVSLGCSTNAAQEHEVIALERAALDRWGNGDPSGLLETYAPEITYFDAGTERRIDGKAAMTSYYGPLTGRITWSRHEMMDPQVQHHGDVAVLTYRLHTEGVYADGRQIDTDWNSTSVYAHSDGGWKMIHSHWSLTALPCAQGIV